MRELCAFQPRRYWPGRWDKQEITEPPAWLLLFLGAKTVRRPLDFSRIMLGMFLIDQQLLDPSGQFYCFDAFEDGPLSVEVHRDLRWLSIGQLIEKTSVQSGSATTAYALTETGREEYARIMQGKTPEQVRAIEEIATYVTSHGLAEILNRIWQEYPEYAVSSVPLAPTGD